MSDRGLTPDERKKNAQPSGSGASNGACRDASQPVEMLTGTKAWKLSHFHQSIYLCRDIISIMSFLWNFRRSKALSAATSHNEDLALSCNSPSSPVSKSDNSTSKDTPDTRESTAGRCEPLPQTRKNQLVHSTEREPMVSQFPKVRPPGDSKMPWDNSRGTTLGDPDPTMLGAPGPIPLALSQPSQPGTTDVGEFLQVLKPVSPSPGEVQSDEAHSGPRAGDIRKDVGDLSEMRLAVVQRRHEAQESRSGLRLAREAMDVLDARFIQEVRVLYANSRSAEFATLFELVEAMQNQRDRFYPMEDNYNKLEDRLDLEEFELHEAESRLYERLGSPCTSVVAANDRASPWPEETLEPYPDNLSPGVQEPAYTDYLSRVGDANIVKERILELRRERMHLVEEERVRGKVGRNLDTEALQFLHSFDRRHQELQDQYATVQEDLVRMREGLPLSIPLPFATTQFADETYSFGTGIIQQLMNASPLITASDLKTSTSASTPPSPRDAIAAAQLPRADPLLLPDNDTTPIFTFGSGREREPISTVTYVNEWLLNRLRRSSMEVWRFKSAEELQALDLDEPQVRDLVIEWWSKDDKAGDFLVKEKARAISLSLTSQPGVKYQPTRMAWSDGVPHDFDRLASRFNTADPAVRRRVVGINFRHNSSGLMQKPRSPPSSV